MKLCVSNIAWNPQDDPEMLPLLRDEGVQAIELAPTKVWPDWEGATSAAAAAYKRRLADAGFEVPSMQAIVFGRPELQLFGAPAQRQALLEHMRLVADLAAALGARALVYGAPKSRDRGTLPLSDAMAQAAELFSQIGAICSERGTCLCIEPNPVAYGCNFVTTSAEGAELVGRVASPGFRLHLDAAGMALSGEQPASAIAAAAPWLHHFHASEPNLGAFAVPSLDHRAYASALSQAVYRGWISIEMRATDAPLTAVRAAVRFVRQTYAAVLQDSR